MLDYVSIITQIESYTGTTFASVGFAQTPQQVHYKAANASLPAVFVSPSGEKVEASDIQTNGNIRQWHEEYFAVVVLWENDGDLLGQNAMDNVGPFQQALRSSIVNWRPLPTTRTSFGVEERDSGLFVDLQGAMTGWIFKYSIKYRTATQDAFIPTPVIQTFTPVLYTSFAASLTVVVSDDLTPDTLL